MTTLQVCEDGHASVLASPRLQGFSSVISIALSSTILEPSS